MNKSRGFTMIELLVVVSIISIFSIIVISNFPQIRLQFALSRVAHRFAQDLRRAQNMALSGIQYKDSNGTLQTINGYGVYANINIFDNKTGSKKYIIYADRQPGNQQYDDLDYVVDTIDFSLVEKGVIIKEINNVFDNKVSVNFNLSNIGTTITQLNQGQNNVNIVFALESDLTKTRSVLVNTSGLVEVE